MILKRLLLLIFLVVATSSIAQSTLKGKIIDESDENPILFSTIYWKSSGLGTVSDQYGKFIIELPTINDTLIINAMGFIKLHITKQEAITNSVFKLKKENIQLDKVIIEKKGRIRRNRKIDPAYLLHKEIVKHKSKNDLKKTKAYQCKIYNKVELDFNNVDSSTKNIALFKPVKFLFKEIDTSTMPKPFIPVFMSEGMSEYYFRNGPLQEKEIIKASKIAGLDIKSLNQFTGNLYLDYNIYEEYINLFQKSMLSPLADQAWLSYNFYITDSLVSNDSISYRLDFFPRRKHDLAFKGFLWVDNKSFGIKKIHLELADNANINYIHLFKIDLEFGFQDSVWVPQKENILIDFYLANYAFGYYGKKTTLFTDYLINQSKRSSFYKNAEKLVVWDSIDIKGADYLKKHRPKPLTKKEQKIYFKVDSAMRTPYMRFIKNTSQMFATGYYPFKYFEIGKWFTTYSFNSIEGNRYRIGGLTTPATFPTTRIGGRIAYGTSDKRIKYQAEITQYYQLKKRRYFRYEFFYDYKDISSSDNAFLHDNSTVSTFRKSTPKITFINKHHFEWMHEYYLGINNQIHFEFGSYEPNEILNYQRPNGSLVDKLYINTIKFGGRIAMDEKFVQYGFRRLSLATRKPTVDYFYTRGLKINGKGYDFHKVELTFADRWYFGYFGYLDCRINSSKIWGELPYPLLANHHGNNSYYHDTKAFNLMNPFEFVSDQQASLFLTHHFNGMILNHIPLMKKLHWRTLAFARGAIGNLNYNHQNQLLFPDGLSELKEPYIETGVGIENIFKALRVDVLWRLTNNETSKQIISYNFGFYPKF